MKDFSLKSIVLKALVSLLLAGNGALSLFLVVKLFSINENSEFTAYIIALILLTIVTLTEIVIHLSRLTKPTFIQSLVFEENHEINKMGFIMMLAVFAAGIAMMVTGTVFYLKPSSTTAFGAGSALLAIGSWVSIQCLYYLGIAVLLKRKEFNQKDFMN